MRVGSGASSSGDICNGALPLSLSEQISPSFSGLDWEGLAPQPQGLLGLSPGQRVLPKPLLHPGRVSSASAPVYTGVRVLGGPQPLPYAHSTPRVGALTRESPLATIFPLLRSPSIYSGPQHFHLPPPCLLSNFSQSGQRAGDGTRLRRYQHPVRSEFLRPRRPVPRHAGTTDPTCPGTGSERRPSPTSRFLDLALCFRAGGAEIVRLGHFGLASPLYRRRHSIWGSGKRAKSEPGRTRSQ